MAKQHDKQFKLDAVQYYQDHKNLGIRGCAENLGIGYSTLTKWLKDFRESGDIPVRGSGNYASDVLTIGIVLCLFYIICGTVSFVLRLFHILKTSFCFSVRFSELPS